MQLTLLLLLLFAVLVYWLLTQLLPQWRRARLVRPRLGEALWANLNAERHERGLPLLELDRELSKVAENKAVHQLATGDDEEGWEYPATYVRMFGRSLLLEMLFSGELASMTERMSRESDLFEGEWCRCGIGVAGEGATQAVALILCRQAWEPMAEAAPRELLQSD